MRKLIPIFVFLAIPLAAQIQTKPVTKATPKRPVAAQPTAIIDTTAGKLTCTLFPDKAPIGAKNFIDLARGTKTWINPATGKVMHHTPLYNGTIFHRVIPEFMIQGGDPLGNGRGGPEGPGYPFKNETSPDLTFDRPGRLAYANAGPNTNASQFFITEAPYPSLDGNYTIFGQCDQPSVEVVKKIARMPRDANDNPDNPVKIEKITILHAPGTAVHHAPVHKPMPKPAPHSTKQQ